MNVLSRLSIIKAILGLSVLLTGGAYVMRGGAAWWGALLVANLVALALLWRAHHALRHSCESIQNALARLKQGDWHARIPDANQSSLGTLAQEINQSLGHMAQAVEPMASQASTLRGAVATLMRQVDSLAQQTQTQNQTTSAVANTMAEMASSVASAARSAEEVRQLTELSLNAAERGNISMSELIGEITMVEKAVQHNADAVREFVHSASAITAMTQQVKNIADQTNLLALNAAIEAARAGEQGRGFAVVADEVRNLAVKSAQSTSEIDKVTVALGKGSSSVEESINDGMSSLKAIEAFLEKLAVVLIEARDTVQRSEQGVTQISGAMQEQSHASDDLSRTLESITKSHEQQSTSIRDVMAGVRALEALAAQMHDTARSLRPA